MEHIIKFLENNQVNYTYFNNNKTYEIYDNQDIVQESFTNNNFILERDILNTGNIEIYEAKDCNTTRINENLYIFVYVENDTEFECFSEKYLLKYDKLNDLKDLLK